MALLVALVAGLLVFAESQAHDKAGRSTPQEFLSKYLPVGSDVSRTPLGHYDKFIIPNLKHMQHGPASHGPAADDTQYLDMAEEEDRAVQNLLANGNNSTPIRLCAIGIGFLALVTMLVARLRRGQSTSILASSGGLGSDVSVSMAPVLLDNVMEMSPQDVQMNSAAACETRHLGEETSRRVGWRQMSSQNSDPLTLCYAGKSKGRSGPPPPPPPPPPPQSPPPQSSLPSLPSRLPSP